MAFFEQKLHQKRATLEHRQSRYRRHMQAWKLRSKPVHHEPCGNEATTWGISLTMPREQDFQACKMPLKLKL